MLHVPFQRDSEGGHKAGPTIVVSGSPGSGKSTYARRLSIDLGLKYYSSGEIFRAIARERGVSIVELSRMAESDPSVDIEIERKTLSIAEKGGVVIDSHLAAWILASTADMLVYVKAPLKVRAERLAARDGKSVAESYREIIAREESQAFRFAKYYGLDTRDLSIFHLILDTGAYSLEEAYSIIKLAVVKRLKSLGYILGENI
ncbi:MAG: AAA family ATPase [Thermoprotei archaeon]|nr:AAA family ATPase [Thermoprotei archaeon]